ncbi:MAG: hypothetical protein ACUVUD_05535 [bacterium]
MSKASKVVLAVFGLLTVVCSAVFATDGPLWVRTHDGAGHGDDQVCAVLSDGERNVVVVGTVVGRSTAYDIVVLKYSASGESIWVQTIAGPGTSNEIAVAAAIDASGAIYLTGTTGTYPNYNILTLKLNSNGSEAWRAVYEGRAGKEDRPFALVLDGDGNVYVTGYEKNADNVEDYVTIKYSGSGNRQWVMNYDGGAADVSKAIALGADGAVYVTGSSVQGGNNDNILTVKYSASGTQEWEKFYGADSTPELGVGVAADNSGVYVVAQGATRPLPAPYKMIVVKYAPNGNQLWSKSYNGSNRGVEPAGVVVNSSGLYVTGTVTQSANTDIYTVAYNTGTGDTLWLRLFNAPANKNDIGSAILVDGQGRVHIVGSAQNAAGNSDYCRLRYSATGALQGAALYNSSYNNDDKGLGMAIDANQEVVVTGLTYGGSPVMTYDITTVKYDSAVPGISEARPFPARFQPELRLQPNPARGSVRVELNGEEGVIMLWSAYGALCQKSEIRGGLTGYRLSLRGLSPGVYIVEVKTGSLNRRAKLLVE